MEKGHSYDLISMLRIIIKNIKFILTVTILAVAVIGIMYFVKPPKYEAQSEFLISNFLTTDKSFIFRNDDVNYVDYFASESAIDKAYQVLSSEQTLLRVGEQLNLYQHYGIDPNGSFASLDLIEVIKGSLKIKKTANLSVEIRYKDTDPAMAAAVVNTLIKEADREYFNLLMTIRKNSLAALNTKYAELDSLLNVYTDSLTAVRKTYGITEILNPNRQNLIVSNNLSTAKIDGIELVQNIEAVKDQLLIDKSKYISLIREIETTIDAANLNQFQQLYPALTPKKRSGLGFPMTLAVGFIVVFGCMSVFSIVRDLFKQALDN
jgi:uncharacterized protein involved in exopolysaccharide biosynthesis